MHDTINLSEKDGKHRSSITGITYAILGIIVLLAVGMPTLQSLYIYPQFIKLIIKNTENEAVRAGRHLTREVLSRISGSELVISVDIQTYLDNSRADYDLWKVKLFSESGKTVYSTDRNDIGKNNTHTYFKEVVSMGQVYTKVVQKNTKSLEGQVVTNDVVETYIPIMKKGVFIGAFELYYNISVRKQSMDLIISRTNVLLYCLSGLMIIVAVGATFGLKRGERLRKNYSKQLYNLATKDMLTGAYTRRRFTELLQWEITKFDRYEKYSCLLMFDIDHFKNVNDTYGHHSGDDVLIAVTDICRQSLRASDLFGRYGGEEFVVLLPDTERKGGIRVAEKLRTVVEGLTTPSDTKTIQVTISIGMVDLNEVQPLTVETVTKMADDCLYKAKERGRNRVCTSEDLISDD